MTPLETNLNYISSLPDDPTITTSALKQEFDKAGNVIKNFINSVLEAEITSDIATCLASAKAYADEAVGAISLTASNISYDNSSSGLIADDTQEAIDELKTTITSSISSITTDVSKKSVYSDFPTTTGTATVNVSPLQDYIGTVTVTANGHYPLGVVGVHFSRTYADMQLLRWQITSKSNGRAVVTYRILNADNTRTLSATVSFDVLWAKIR